jgi:Spy/CpxP family protein refolding chaperone
MRKTWLLAALPAAFLLVLPANAQMVEMPAGKWWKRPKVVETLQVTAEQQQRLDEVFSKNRRAFVDLKADVERRTIDLEELLAARDVDPKKVAAASDSLEQARGRLGKARTMMVVEMRGILTEAQWKQILDRRDQWRSERETEMRKRIRAGRMGAGPQAGRPGAAPQAGGPPPGELPDEP